MLWNIVEVKLTGLVWLWIGDCRLCIWKILKVLPEKIQLTMIHHGLMSGLCKNRQFNSLTWTIYVVAVSNATYLTQWHTHALSWASSQIRKLSCCACTGIAGNFPPSPWVNDSEMYHGTCVKHVSWCMTGSLTSVHCSRWRGKRSRHFQRMRIPQFSVSGKRSKQTAEPREMHCLISCMSYTCHCVHIP